MLASNGDLSPRRAERPSTEIVHSLFGNSVGRCWGDFSCSHYRQRGRLYAASNAIAFFSNLFGFERRICLQLDDVTDIKAFRTTSIQITTVEGEQYIFKSFQNRELVVLLLLQLKQGHSNGTTRHRTDSEESAESIDPPLENETLVDLPTVDGDEMANKTIKQLTDSNTALETLSSMEPDVESDSQGHESDGESVTTDAAIAADVQAPSLTAENTETSTTNDLENSTDIVPEIDCQELWENIKNANDPPYDETSIDALLLPCTLDEFFALFLADNAPHSIDSYQRDRIGDSELTVSSWTEEADGSHVRYIKFRHPLPNGLGVGPPSALAERHQRFRRYGSYGFCLESSTSVKGVIASDSFIVEDKWLVEPSGETNVTLKVKHHVRFTKRTMLKRVIQNTSNSEAQNWYDGYAEMLLSSFKDEESIATPTKEELQKDQTETIVTGQTERIVVPSSRLHAFVILFLWACLMAGIGLLLFRMVSLQDKLMSLEVELARLREENLRAIVRLEEAINAMQLTAKL